jgi:uncharacterized protein YigE (DUF2233 family)
MMMGSNFVGLPFFSLSQYIAAMGAQKRRLLRAWPAGMWDRP